MTLAIAGGDLVLPDRIVRGGLLRIDGDRIAEVAAPPLAATAADVRIDARDCVVVPGFIDVHVHGVDGVDALDGEGAIARIASSLVRFGVTGFCPTTVACAPEPLRTVLAEVRALQAAPPDGGARVIGAHLESNFVHPDMCGAQPKEHLRCFGAEPPAGTYSADDIVREITAARPSVAIVTLAPELAGAMDLIRQFAASGIRVSLGHSTASFAAALAAFDAGATHATHLFNRMRPFHHREPGLAGAALMRDDVFAELILDGLHVHPDAARLALRLKGADRLLAITDASAGAGLAPGSRARLGGRTIHVREQGAVLDDGTLAGSTQTMDGVFRTAVTLSGGSLVDAAKVCATTPARALGLESRGIIATGAAADVVVLDRDLRVRHTCVAGRLVYRG